MNKLFVILLVFIASVITVSAQTETSLKQHFEGKTVKLRIDMPASEGVNIYPERGLAMDYNQYADRLKQNGASVHKGDEVVITRVKVKNNDVEVQLGNEAQAGSRFNVHFKRLESFLLTPESLMDALRRYVDFSEINEGALSMAQDSSYGNAFVRPGVVHLAAPSTYLQEGLSTSEVVRLLGEPTTISERQAEGSMVKTYEFTRGEGRVLVADFKGDKLVGSRTEMRGASANSGY
ncbi:MAG TPA: hypothetical protein VKB46_23075 [Pyrinomonadaceae bacterium]|nr:hypothetical protein [Pyrinomonadaceae bacterium]